MLHLDETDLVPGGGTDWPSLRPMLHPDLLLHPMGHLLKSCHLLRDLGRGVLRCREWRAVLETDLVGPFRDYAVECDVAGDHTAAVAVVAAAGRGGDDDGGAVVAAAGRDGGAVVADDGDAAVAAVDGHDGGDGQEAAGKWYSVKKCPSWVRRCLRAPTYL